MAEQTELDRIEALCMAAIERARIAGVRVCVTDYIGHHQGPIRPRKYGSEGEICLLGACSIGKAGAYYQAGAEYLYVNDSSAYALESGFMGWPPREFDLDIFALGQRLASYCNAVFK